MAELFQERRTIVFPSTTSPVAARSESAQNEVTPVLEASLATVAVPHIAEKKFPEIIPAVNSNAIESLDILKNILVEIIESAQIELKEDAIPVTRIKKGFFAKYHSHADLIVKSFLGKSSSLIKFFQSQSATFKIILIGTEHQVGLVQKPSASKIELSAALEASVAKIVLALTAESPGSYIPIPQVADEFKKQYGQPITKKLKSLDLGTKFPDFLQSCKTFKVKKKGKIYEVAIALP